MPIPYEKEYRGDKYGKSWSNRDYSTKPVRARRWMAYTAAKLTVQELCPATSRAQYFKWHDNYKPVGVPKQPQRVYIDEWEGWNIFLNVENTFDGYDRKFGQKYEWREFWAAVRHIQSLQLTSKLEYLKLHREGGIPKDIPMAPDELPLWRDKWKTIGWNGYLGKTLTTQVNAIKNLEKVLIVCSNSDYASNILEIVIGTVDEVEGILGKRDELGIVRRYVYGEGDDIIFANIVRMGSVQGDNVYLFSNVNIFLSEMDHGLLIVRHPK